MTSTQVRARRARSAAALLGGCAIVAVGAWSAAVGTVTSANEAKQSGMNVGSTTTVTTPPAKPTVAMAVPAIKGPAPLWAGESP